LKGSTVTENLKASEQLDGDSIRLRLMRLRHVGIDSLQALAKQGLLKDTTICNLKFGEHCVLDMKTKVKFDTTIYHSGGLLDCVHIDVWGPTRTSSLRGHQYCLFC